MDNIAILIPCYNEVSTITSVIKDFGSYIPYAHIYVYDNNSVDGSYKKASSLCNEYKVSVKRIPQPGKGCVIRQMFKEIDADIYLLVDADGSYRAMDNGDLIAGVRKGLDMVLGDRTACFNKNTISKSRRYEVKFITNCINKAYNVDLPDALTGYRAFSKKFVKGIDLQSHGFEIDAELCVHAAKPDFKMASVPVTYLGRSVPKKEKSSVFMDSIKMLEIMSRLK